MTTTIMQQKGEKLFKKKIEKIEKIEKILCNDNAVLKGLTNNEAFKTQQNKIENTYTHTCSYSVQKNNRKNKTQSTKHTHRVRKKISGKERKTMILILPPNYSFFRHAWGCEQNKN